MALNGRVRARLSALPLALGGAPLGNLFRALPGHDAVALIRHAFEAGTRYFDTARDVRFAVREPVARQPFGGLGEDGLDRARGASGALEVDHVSDRIIALHQPGH